MSLYNDNFYKSRHNNTVYSAETILSIVQGIVPEVTSAIDVGCGIGTWLKVLEQRGATDICGVDGPWVNKDLLEVNKEIFIEKNLSEDTNLNINRSFDLAISLEVAEHLPASSADDFVELLTSLSDFVLFSAAIPYQGGVGHVNEQWPTYWSSIYKSKGYVGIDVVRKNIWNNEAIPSWYRQNAILFVKEERISDLSLKNTVKDFILPEEYLLSFQKVVFSPRIRPSLHTLLLAIRNRIKRILKIDQASQLT